MLSLLTQSIDEFAARTPEHEAVRFNGRALTYAELSQKSDQLATLLIEQGVKRGDRVAFFLSKGLKTAITLYGIMKAGAAYVPLDVTAPPSRQAFILRDCGIRHLVSAPSHLDGVQAILAEGTPVEVCIGLRTADELAVHAVSWDDVETAPTEAPDVQMLESDLSYILYTSGSTGTPKGVVHTHASGLAYARVTAETHGFQASDRISNYTLLHFDPSTLDYFSAAVAGATTVIIPEMYTKVPASLSALMADERMTVFFAVPFAYTQLLLRGALDKRDLSALRWALFSGEAMPPKVLRGLMEAWPHAEFGNIYGPTELNGVTYHVVPKAFASSGADSVPIGVPYAFASATVVDEDDQPVESGTTGELLVHSDTAMQGYWGRPDLTANAFVERHGEPYYRTGDLVRQRDDGVFLFLGRKDRQVKTRGHRVELAEVEAILCEHASVDAAAAFTVPDTEGSHRILAAVSVQPGTELTMRDLREFALSRLPAYAVPEALTTLDPFPRTPTGKVDRLAATALATRQLVPTDTK